MFTHVGNMGGQNYKAEVELAAVSIAAGSIIYNVSGYGSNATVGNVKTHNLIGITVKAVDNSGGSVGDLSVLTEQSPLALYEVGTAGTLDQTLIWTNMTLEDMVSVDENDAVDTDTGVVFARGMISSSKLFCSLNFSSPADA